MPQMGIIIGTIWGTQKYPGLEDAKMQIMQPICGVTRQHLGQPITVVDTVGAGPGETVLYITAYEAVIPYHRDMVPIDAAVVGIVESTYVKDTTS
ncbi:EutN/CcmL family microcompartment protein [Candidatus Uabimicrobium amorphum]|uniref:Ethanolamine utilization protein EutN n=1 Tax=Uabimicrobium amorphum TaxID=2596890 RepID=A0A5S9F454_UABAM|nr:EutN/CcmL family microcompartment protein [Candidatus Uabimicrobium amorphum]BBM85447.1 ethanolamine utilization protein EutN [Candidatus Uabimicrobium amorphum]